MYLIRFTSTLNEGCYVKGVNQLTGLDQFLQIFGNVTVSDIVMWVFALLFLFLIYKEIKKYVSAKIEEQKACEEEKKKEKAKLDEAWNVTQKYPQYHQESITIRDGLKQEIKEMRDDFAIILKRLDDMEALNKKRECSKLRDMLLQNYRYYTNQQQNPSQSWTRMESEAFWELFKEYEEAGGDGYMHTEVQPAMERLLVVEVGQK